MGRKILFFVLLFQSIFFTLFCKSQAKALPKFAISKDTICVNESIGIFDNSIGVITTYQWNFGSDAFPSNASGNGPFTIKYRSAGFKKITLTLNGDTTLIKDSIIYVRPTPKAQFTVNDTDQCMPSNTFFMSSNSIFIGNVINKWILGDGNTIIKNNVTYSYANSGYYNVKLISNSNFCTDTASMLIHVFPKPIAQFNVIKSKVCLNDNSFIIENLTLNKNKFNTIFYLGDGNGRLDNNFTYKYDAVGTFYILLTVGLGIDCQDTISQPVSIFENPKSIFTIKNQFQCLKGNSFEFTNLSQKTTSLKWLFGDNSTSNISNPVHTYNNDGTFKIQLIASALNNCVDTSFIYTTVYPKPNPLFTVNDTAQCFADNSFNFTAISNIKNGTIENAWILPNGNKLIKDDFVQSFDVFGYLPITLIVASDRDCKDTLVKNILVYDKINAFFNIETIDLETKKFTALEKPSFNFNWKISDGSSYSVPSFNHFFSKNDSIYVNLIVSDTNGCKDSSFYFFNINSPALKVTDNPFNYYLYPNPTRAKINFKIELTQSDFINYQIVNSEGQIVVSNKLDNLKSGIYFYEFNFNDYNYSKGIYTLSMITSKGKLTEKIVYQ